jgi:hypothetical protein
MSGAEGLTHFQWLQAEKARVRAAAAKRMSASALARLPKPITAKREALPPVVLATRQHAVNVTRQQACKKSAQRRGEHFVRRVNVDLDHLREVADVVARRFRRTAAEVFAARKSQSETMAARHIVVWTVLEVTRSTLPQLARAAGVSLDIIKSSKGYGDQVIARSAAYAEKYGRAKNDICARWPQYHAGVHSASEHASAGLALKLGRAGPG